MQFFYIPIMYGHDRDKRIIGAGIVQQGNVVAEGNDRFDEMQQSWDSSFDLHIGYIVPALIHALRHAGLY